MRCFFSEGNHMEEENERKEKDLFDRMLSLPILRVFYPFYRQHRAVLLYLFFGAVTTFVNFLTFWILRRCFLCPELVANIIAWILSVLVAFCTNRRYVFRSRNGAVFRELLHFTGLRVGTLLLEEGAIFLFVTCLSCYDMLVKAVVAVAVVILNYLFSRLWVFRNR